MKKTAPPVAVRWIARPHPLPMEGAAGWGETALALARRLLQRSDEDLARLGGISAGDILIVTGPAEALPWADGVRYLGRDPLAPSILIPTTLTTSVPITLLQRAICARAGAQAPPLAVLPERNAILSLSLAEPLSRARLDDWLRERPAHGHRSGGTERREG